MRNRIIGYSLAVVLYILAEFINYVNYFNFGLLALSIILLKCISFFLIYFTYLKNKYYIDIYDDHIEGVGRLNGKTSYLYIKFFAMEEVHGEIEKTNVIAIYTYDENKYEIPLNSRYFDAVLQQLLKKHRSINCRELYKFFSGRD